LKDTASSLLSELRRKIHHLQRKVQEKAAKIAHNAAEDQISDIPQVAFRNGRLVIPVRASRKNQIVGIIHDQSQSGQTIYIEPMVIVELNNELRQAELAEQDEVYRILKEKTDQIRPFEGELISSINSYHHLDLLHAKALFSVEFKCEMPVRDDEGFHLKGARNLELELKRDVVPLTLKIASDIRGVVITGPNAGGKTVTLKTIGLLVLINQAGLLLPAEYADIPDFDAVFIDIGDGQSIDGDLSTYSSHINRLKDIVENASSKSLVLLDELGTGTDPDEGAALAEAILTHLCEKGALVIATTHHSALKSFAYNHPQLINGSMSFNDRDLAPSYEFKAGIPQSSYAIEIARRYHLPESILEYARKRIGKGREKLEKLITDLQRKIHRYDSDLKELKTRNAEIKEKARNVDKLKKEIDAKYKK
ncbi:MAG: endonuclease MutS2, partial [Candidatus Marinimicrobia bacterium]|nr:endonuclease MutS2 [Candidatus Neomarinimicrobiota bacterium]